jgi:hypothetical protein
MWWIRLSNSKASTKRYGESMEAEAQFARRLIIGFGWGETNHPVLGTAEGGW